MRKTLKYLAIATGSILTILIIILAAHIYQVTQNKEVNPTAAWQLARIDINESLPLNQNAVKESKRILNLIEGVQRVVVNKEQGNIIIGFFPTQLSREDIFIQFSKKSRLNASLFTPSKEQLAAGCPVIDQESVTYKVGAFFQNVFQNQ